MATQTVGTFRIRGNKTIGYFIEDTDTFNDWGIKNSPNGSNFKSREDAAEYAQRCHEFKCGRRRTIA